MKQHPSLLIVDDEVYLTEILSEVAAPLFNEIHICHDGTDALEFLKTNEVSLVLSDITMPKMNGDKFLLKLRSLGIFTPVVFLTGNPSMELAIKALQLGAVDFLEKPVKPEILKMILLLSLEIHEHKKELTRLEEINVDSDRDLIRSERRTLGIKQAALTLKKTA